MHALKSHLVSRDHLTAVNVKADLVSSLPDARVVPSEDQSRALIQPVLQSSAFSGRSSAHCQPRQDDRLTGHKYPAQVRDRLLLHHLTH